MSLDLEQFEKLETGDLIEKKDLLSGDWIEYQFIEHSEERLTVLGKRISDDRPEWINIKQIRITGRKVQQQDPQPLQNKKTRWTLFEDDVPEHLIKKKTRRKK